MSPTEQLECFSDSFPGGAYRADRDPDGHYTIRDVPFFSELPAGVRSNEKPIGRDWMEAVVKHHRRRESEEKFLAPVHANHHGTGRTNFRIGFLRPTRVGQLQLDGKTRWTLFGDITRVPEEHFQTIKEIGYPYRSAEINPAWTPEIASLALSEDEAPHFKLPMLTIGEERHNFSDVFQPQFSPAVAFSEVGNSAFICFSFRGEDMAKTAETFQDEKDEKKEDEKKMSGKKLQDGEEKDKKKEPDEKKGEERVDPKTLSDPFLTQLLESNQKLTETVGRLSGQICALEEKEEKREQVAQVEILSANAIKDLKSKGWHLSESTEKAIRDIATQSDKALEVFVETYKANTPKDPPRSIDEIDASEVFNEDPPEVLKFTTQSPDKLEKARELSKMFDELGKSATMSVSREEFIDFNMKPMEYV